MPTYKNNGDTAINYESKGKLYSIPPHKEYQADFWLPYQELGLELVNADYPPVPDSLILSGIFGFGFAVERKFNITHCDKYKVKISVKSGSVRLYAGTSKIGVEISGDYETVLDWERAPYIRVVGLSSSSEVRMDAETA